MKFATVGFKTEDGVISVEAVSDSATAKFAVKKNSYVRQSFVLKGTINQIIDQLNDMMIRRITNER